MKIMSNKSKYTPIHASEMQEALLEIHPYFREVKIPGTHEQVYEAPVKGYQFIAVRVYTTIEGSTGVSRDCGADAIRILLYDKEKDRPIGKTKKSLRTKNWRTTIKDKIISIGRSVTNFKCDSPGCDGWMVERKSGKGSKFMGCTNYPECKNTKSFKETFTTVEQHGIKH